MLKDEFKKNTDFKIILTREKDNFIKLRNRTKIAKKNNADIFISLHADFNRNKRARGISLYTLSENASDKEAAALARRENKSDLIEGVDLSTESSEVTSILLDLTKRDTLNQSSLLVNFLIDAFKKDMNLLQRTHRYAGFAVLKSLDIPSVLIEMGYLSNKHDSKLLVTDAYQRKLSKKIVRAVIDYFNWQDKNNG
jgi:N-acetylmuramoyl-L-alanine amidase